MKDSKQPQMPKESPISPDVYANLAEVLSFVQQSIERQLPGFPRFSADQIKIFPADLYHDFLRERDEASAHPFYLKLVQREPGASYSDSAFNDFGTKTSFYNSDFFDYLKKQPQDARFIEMGLHLIHSAVSLGFETQEFKSKNAKRAAQNAIKHHLPEMAGVTADDAKAAVRFIEKSGCTIKIYGASFQILVDGAIFTPAFGQRLRRIIVGMLSLPIRRDFINAIATELKMPNGHRTQWLAYAQSFAQDPEQAKYENPTVELLKKLGFANKDEIAEGFATSQIGRKIIETIYS